MDLTLKLVDAYLFHIPEGVSEKNISGHLCRKILKKWRFFDFFSEIDPYQKNGV